MFATMQPVRQVEERSGAEVSAPPGAARVRLEPVAISISDGTAVGQSGSPPGCHVPLGNTWEWQAAKHAGAVGGLVSRVLAAEFQRGNYRPASSAGASAKPARVMRVEATVTAMTVNNCFTSLQDPLINLARLGRGDSVGEGYMRVAWEISGADGGVHRLVSEGSAKVDEPTPWNQIRVRVLTKVFAVAVRNFLSDPRFRALAEAGAAPAGRQGSRSAQ